ncbi:MAG TPA: helix-turn-helix domain-containing protein, partial [Egibacteraceae bacterium]|nr:helix-turn-helix domain-containing protein [Egibacteraceae bacterium]
MSTPEDGESARDGASRIGQVLQQERVKRGQDGHDAAWAAGVPGGMVEEIEAGRLPLDGVENRAYLRIYARHLGLDVEALLRQLEGPAPEGDKALSPLKPLEFPTDHGSGGRQHHGAGDDPAPAIKPLSFPPGHGTGP